MIWDELFSVTSSPWQCNHFVCSVNSPSFLWCSCPKYCCLYLLLCGSHRLADSATWSNIDSTLLPASTHLSCEVVAFLMVSLADCWNLRAGLIFRDWNRVLALDLHWNYRDVSSSLPRNWNSNDLRWNLDTKDRELTAIESKPSTCCGCRKHSDPSSPMEAFPSSFSLRIYRLWPKWSHSSCKDSFRLDLEQKEPCSWNTGWTFKVRGLVVAKRCRVRIRVRRFTF